MTTHRSDASWVEVCRDADVPVERGVVVLVDDRQIALFRTYGGDLYALGNRDPFSGANVLARGIVGTRGDAPTVTSPIYKQAFDLTTGTCLDDGGVRIPVYSVRLRHGRVEVLL
ncbi:MAG TPA: nitrite reductase small subunit NirD [Jatrophihabitantaceae bacterium]|jgi:nitrite reductase (NADH) small subunit|nr:nitrite reductase small subunit NirD [Jatrophihabitantaceae bacterium]